MIGSWSCKLPSKQMNRDTRVMKKFNEACGDAQLIHKQAVFDHLVGRWRDLFNASFDVLLYDLTSTYFEADPPFAEGDKRRHG